MKFWKIAAVAAVCGIVFLSCTSGAPAADAQKPEPGPQQAEKLDRTIKVAMNYLLYLPKDYTQQDSWPLLLFLHGAGERGDNLEQVKMHGPPKLIAAGKEFPFIVVSPQCPSSQWWQPHELNALLDEIVEKYKVDQDRIYVTGLSMGGFGSWSLAGFAPDRLAALVPICGGGDPNMVRRLSRLPVWVFHGAKDSVVPLAASERMVEALKKANSDVKFTVYPEADHDSWTATYDNPELYTWLLQQKRTPKEPAVKKN